MTTTIGPYVVGEIPPPLTYQFLDADGEPINLTGYTVTFRYHRLGTDGVELDAEWEAATTGVARYIWTVDNAFIPGLWGAEFWAAADNEGTRFASGRLSFHVRAAVPVAAP